MSAARWHPVRRRRAVAALAGALAVATGIGGLLAPAGAASTRTATTSIPTPLATSLQTTAGTWATLPMGHLNQPLNTFWQLFFLPVGTASWTNEVRATATATNGGLVLATALGQPLIAGIRPSNLLRFSPLIATANGGKTWGSGVLPEGLSARPDALSIAASGRTLALVNRGTDSKVLVTAGNLSTWRTLTTTRELASERIVEACGIRSLSAVTALAATSVIGAECARAGAVGIYTERAGAWVLDSPTLPAALRQRDIQVLSLEGTATGFATLLRVPERSGAALVSAWNTGGKWTVSPPMMLVPGGRLVSMGPASGSGYFVLSTTASGAKRLATIDGSDPTWTQLPPPPRGTATVAFAPAPASSLDVDALSGGATALTVWSLRSGSSIWVKTQVLRVELKFGSST